MPLTLLSLVPVAGLETLRDDRERFSTPRPLIYSSSSSDLTTISSVTLGEAIDFRRGVFLVDEEVVVDVDVARFDVTRFLGDVEGVIFANSA